MIEYYLEPAYISGLPAAMGGGVTDALRGVLPEDTLTGLAALIKSKRGKSLIAYDEFPPLFKLGGPGLVGVGCTSDQLVAAGKFENAAL